MTLLEDFAVRAPPVPAWYAPARTDEPVLDPGVSPIYSGPKPQAIKDHETAWMAWAVEYEQKRVATWPWFYAQMVLAEHPEPAP